MINKTHIDFSTVDIRVRLVARKSIKFMLLFPSFCSESADWFREGGCLENLLALKRPVSGLRFVVAETAENEGLLWGMSVSLSGDSSVVLPRSQVTKLQSLLKFMVFSTQYVTH